MERNSDCQGNQSQNIKSNVTRLLEKDPLLLPKMICDLLGLDYKRHGDYVCHIRSKWRSDSEFEQGSNCSKFDDVHGWRGFCYLPDGLVSRRAALDRGWVESKSRNRFLLWKDLKLGRMQWFETNRVNLYVRKPAHLGKAYQLFCQGFYANELITDIKILEPILKGIKFKSAHFVFQTSQRLPRMNISLFQEPNGVFIKLGDRSHPSSVEVIASYMDWVERLERLGESQIGLQKQQLQATSGLTKVLDNLFPPGKSDASQDRTMIV